MIKARQVTRYVAICDGCGKRHHHEADTEIGMQSVAQSYDWHSHEDKLYCKTCPKKKRQK